MIVFLARGGCDGGVARFSMRGGSWGGVMVLIIDCDLAGFHWSCGRREVMVMAMAFT